MKVDLAYPWTDDEGTTYEPDTTVDVPDAVGKTLVRDGRARRTTAPQATPSDAPAPGADTTKEAGS